MRFLVETHSETFLLRLRRRIAEGSVAAADVAVYFVENEGGSASARRIEIDSMGNLDYWPRGVFAEDFERRELSRQRRSTDRQRMRVELSVDLFDSSDHVEDIAELMRLFGRGRRDWVISAVAVACAETYFRQHLPGLSPIYQEMAMKAATAQSWTVDERPALLVTAQTAAADVADLRQAALLFVEDAISDRCFVLGLAHALDEADVVQAIEDGLLEIRHGGGKSRTFTLAAAELTRFARTHRVAALVDSDRMTPSERPGCEKSADSLRSRGGLVHVLMFREAENYVPNKVLAAIRPYRESSKKLVALKELTCEQRAHFDMKRGFPERRSGEPPVPKAHGTLYDGVSGQTIDRLRAGFGTDLTERLRREAEQGGLAESHFLCLGEGVVPELRELLAMLRKII
ncbi:hypothetical protein Acor_30650 [Acrocarpospora corrugata]|uniref:DUF3696 domain-containing protein n=1 Tax=Acrocarpospora corrugata TaxID=35763 RepID=A0A5M3W1K2_9ACTN|nr:DUF3696 domain-containing protein [Acrocarpospora corrugata]GES01001.1 hypothetical protein Acor_30650 [Acrocarpospora corrugata]